MLKNVRKFGLMIAIAVAAVGAMPSAWAAPVWQIIEAGGKPALDALATAGVKSSSGRQQALESLVLSLKALGGNADRVPNPQALKNVLKGDLLRILEQDISKLNTADLAKLVNGTAELAKGKQLGELVMACSQCVDQELAKLGIQYVSKPATNTMKQLLESPATPEEIYNGVARLGKHLRISDLGVGQGQLIDQIRAIAREDADLAARIHGFMKICTSKKTAQRDACVQVLGMMRDPQSGAVNFKEQRMFMIMYEDFSDEEFKNLTKVFNDINKQGKGSPQAKRQAFEAWFTKQAKSQNIPEDEISRMRAKLKECGYIG